MVTIGSDTWQAVPLGAPATQTPKAADQQAQDATGAKAAMEAATAPSAAIAASMATSVAQHNVVQASADVLRLSGQALAKSASTGASALGASGNILTSIDKAAQGDTYSAAAAAQTAVQKISPTLMETPVGAAASAVLIGTGHKKLASQADQLKDSAAKALDPNAKPVQRVKAAFDATVDAQGIANIGRAMGNAVAALGQFAVQHAAKVESLAPVAGKLEAGVVKVAESPLGKGLRWLDKWIPLLNVAGVALSAKEAVDVFRNRKSSTTTKALSIASIGTAAAGLVAGLTLGGGAFLGTIAASVVADLALASARNRDARQGDLDTLAKGWLAHPGMALGQLVDVTSHAARVGAGKLIGILKHAGPQPKGVNPPRGLDAGRSLTANPH